MRALANTIDRAIVALTVLVCSVLCACSQRFPQQEGDVRRDTPRYGGNFRLVAQAPESLDPIHSTYYWESEIVLQIFDGLVRFDSELNIASAIARDWSVSSDGRTYTFQLRPDVRFHNGRAVVADDFVFSFNRLLDPRSQSQDAQHYLKIAGAREFRLGRSRQIEGLRAIRPQTLEIRLDEPYAPFLSLLAQQPAAVVPKEEVLRSDRVFGRSPVGTGPFKLSQWTAESLRLEANRDYFEGAPYLSEIRIKTTSSDLNAEETLAEFLAGGLDLTFVPARKLDLMRRRSDCVLHIRPALRLMYLGFNLRNPVTASFSVREAVMRSIDKARLAADDPDLSAIHSLIPTTLLGSNPGSYPNPFNPQMARQALSQAGFGAVQPLRLTLWHPSPSPERRQFLTNLTAILRTSGIHLEVQTADTTREFLDRIARGQSQVFLYGEVIDFPDPDAILSRLFHSKGEGNVFGYANPEIDRTLDMAQRTLDQSRRAELYQRAEKRILQDIVIVPLFLAKYSIATRKEVRGLELSPLGLQYLPLRTIWLELEGRLTQPAEPSSGA
ncbi:MAG: ABC transporter substrate-binding protein [Acidobacteriota bacterium]